MATGPTLQGWIVEILNVCKGTNLGQTLLVVLIIHKAHR